MKKLRNFLKIIEKKRPEREHMGKNDTIGKKEGHDRKKISLEPIGTIHTPYKDDKDVPHQAYKSNEVGEVEVFEEYEEGLKDIEGFSHIILLYEFNKPVKRSVKENYHLKSYGLTVKPFLDDSVHGLFSTRSPDRPNPIGLSVVKLLERNWNILKVKGVDMLDETPLIDIKPNVPKFDQREKTTIGWLEDNL